MRARDLPKLKPRRRQGGNRPCGAVDSSTPRRRLDPKPAGVEHRAGARHSSSGRRALYCTWKCTAPVRFRTSESLRGKPQGCVEVSVSIRLCHLVGSPSSLRHPMAHQSGRNRTYAFEIPPPPSGERRLRAKFSGRELSTFVEAVVLHNGPVRIQKHTYDFGGFVKLSDAAERLAIQRDGQA